ncbi:AraC family transcriptional regulator [Bacillaceae bacterium S4-13-56]
MTENNQSHTIHEGEYLFLVPGFEHYGHKGCEEETIYTWIHFATNAPIQLLEKSTMVWSEILQKESTFLEPGEYRWILPRKKKVEHRLLLERILDQLLYAHQSTHPLERIEEQPIFQQVLVHIQKEGFDAPTSSENIAQQAIQYIEKHYQEEFRIQEMAQELHFHPDYVARVMKQTTGLSPVEYANQFRITKAKHLLVNTDLKVAAISHDVGIKEQTYFSRLFKKYEGVTPIEYRELMKRN